MGTSKSYAKVVGIYKYIVHEHWRKYYQYYLFFRGKQYNIFRKEIEKDSVFYPSPTSIVEVMNRLREKDPKHICDYCIAGSIVYFFEKLAPKKDDKRR